MAMHVVVAALSRHKCEAAWKVRAQPPSGKRSSGCPEARRMMLRAARPALMSAANAVRCPSATAQSPAANTFGAPASCRLCSTHSCPDEIWQSAAEPLAARLGCGCTHAAAASKPGNAMDTGRSPVHQNTMSAIRWRPSSRTTPLRTARLLAWPPSASLWPGLATVAEACAGSALAPLADPGVARCPNTSSTPRRCSHAAACAEAAGGMWASIRLWLVTSVTCKARIQLVTSHLTKICASTMKSQHLLAAAPLPDNLRCQLDPDVSSPNYDYGACHSQLSMRRCIVLLSLPASGLSAGCKPPHAWPDRHVVRQAH